MPIWDPTQLQDIQWGYLQPVRKTVPVTQIPFLAWTPPRVDVSTNLIDRQWAELPPPPRKLPFMTALQMFEPIAAEPQRYDPAIYNDEPWIDGQAVRPKLHASLQMFQPQIAELRRYDFSQYIDKQWTDPRDMGNTSPGPGSSLAMRRVSTIHYPAFGKHIDYFSPNTDYYQDTPWEDGQAVRNRYPAYLQPFEPIGPEVLRYDPSVNYVDRQWNEPQAVRLKMLAALQFFHTRNPTQFSFNEYYLDKQWADPRETWAPLRIKRVSTIHYPSFGIRSEFYSPNEDEYVDRPWQDGQAVRNRTGIAQFAANDLRWPSRPPLINIADTYKWPEPPWFRPQRMDMTNRPMQVQAPFFFGPPLLIAEILDWWTDYPDAYRFNPRLPVDVQGAWLSNRLPIFTVRWLQAFSEPRRYPRQLLAADQLVTAYTDEPDFEEGFWFQALSEPRRYPKRLIPAAHPDSVRNLRFMYKPSGRGYIIN